MTKSPTSVAVTANGSPGHLEANSFSIGPLCTHWIASHPAAGDPLAPFRAAVEYSEENRAQIAAQFVFCGNDLHPELASMLTKAYPDRQWPIMWQQGDACSGGHLNGVQTWAVSGVPLKPLSLDGQLTGCFMETDTAEVCILADIRPRNVDQPRQQQASEMFERLDRALHLAGMDFVDVVRTWLYLDNLLDWYNEFNVARTSFFKRKSVFDHMVPASTGIGAGNPFGAAVSGAALAIRPKNDRLKVFPVPSPLQCPALDYKSSFSRAVEIDAPDTRNLLISGTASIDPDGKSVFVDDPVQQVQLTMEVVQAILESRSMSWEDATRSIAYFKDMRYVPIYKEYCRAHGLESFPTVLAHTDICREELLFEIELDAVQRT